jgi:predicted ATPase/DNA-binding SARP family transcriptional activator
MGSRQAIPQLRLFLFGPPCLVRSYATRTDAGRAGDKIHISLRKAQALLAYLAVTRQRHTRDALATLFWPDDNRSKARGNLRRTLSRLNRALGEGQLEIDRESAGFHPGANLWLDVDHFRRCLTECECHGHPAEEVCADCLAPLSEAVSCYADDFLAGFSLPDSPVFDEWQFFQTESQRQALAFALERLIRGHSALGDYTSAIPYAQRWLALDPLHEPAHQRLMELYAQTGQHAAAMRQYQTCVRVLDEELGISPSGETVALYEAIKMGRMPPEPVPRTEESPPTPGFSVGVFPRSSRPLHNLPPQATPFIGREAELAGLDELFTDAEVRLVTIVGPGGIGKTRLALAAAERQLAQSPISPPSPTAEPALLFPNGVFFVSFTPLSSLDQIAPNIAKALNFRLETGQAGGQTRSSHQQLLDYLRQKHLLLLLDNFEHMLTPSQAGTQSGAGLLVDILQSAPGVRILVTSRERLHLHQEQVYPIQGLEFPDLETIEGAGEYSAIRLFLQSARRVRLDFEPDAEGLIDLIRICHLVEGMPLGIELAASWVDMLSPADIAAEIRQSIHFLETGVRDIPERHRSMRAAFDTSWQRLSEVERNVFSDLSVFRGGFTRKAAQQVTGAALNLLATLAGKSLLQYDKKRDRYQIHELLRQYGADKLAEDPAHEAEVRDRHSAYYCAALGQNEAGLQGARQQATVAEIEADIENAQAAWDWAVAQKQSERLDQSLTSLGQFYEWRGRYQEGEIACRRVAEKLAAEKPFTEQRILAKVLAWHGVFSWRMGNAQLANQLLRQGLGLLDDPSLANQDTRHERAFILLSAGIPTHYTGDRQEAKSLLNRSLALYRALEDPWGTANVQEWLSRVAYNLGAYQEARQLAQESLALRQALCDRRGVARSLDRLGIVTLFQGQLAGGKRFLQESIAIHRELGDLVSVAHTTGSLAAAFARSGDYVQARDLRQQAVAIYDELGVHDSNRAHNQVQIGGATMHLGGYEAARTHVKTGLKLARKIGEQRTMAIALVLLGQINLAKEGYAEAQHRLREGITVYRAIGQRSEEVAGALSSLGLAAQGLDDTSRAEQYAYEALQIAASTQAAVAFVSEDVLAAMACILAQQAKRELAMELYALASRCPRVANSRWFEDVAGRHVAEVAGTLPPEVAQGAQARGQSLDLSETIAKLLSEFPHFHHVSSTSS